MAIIIPANSAADTGFSVANSCRFNDGDTPYFSKSFGTPSDGKKWTFSCWVKGGDLGNDAPNSDRNLIGARIDASNYTDLRYLALDRHMYWLDYTSGAAHEGRVEPRKLRDPAAWMHHVWACDTTQGTPANRMKFYINGVDQGSLLVGAWGSYPDEDDELTMNKSGATVDVGRSPAGYYYWDGYMAEVVFIDGTQYAASDFGEYDEDSPTIWKPKDISGLTFGDNGFYLDFKDSANLGNDANGGTDLSENNIAAVDQCLDSPTNNFCTMNPLENFIPAHTFSEGNNTIATTDASETYTMSTFGVTKGKWYFEALLDGTTYSEFSQIGVASTKGPAAGDYLGDTQTGYGYDNTGNYRKNDDDSIDIVSYGDTFTGGDIIGVYLDLDNSKLYFGKNGTIQNSGTGISITAAASALITGTYFFCVGDRHGDDAIWHCNFGNGSFGATAVSSGNTDGTYGNFEYDPSAGTFDGASKSFKAICTKNLAEYG